MSASTNATNSSSSSSSQLSKKRHLEDAEPDTELKIKFGDETADYSRREGAYFRGIVSSMIPMLFTAMNGPTRKLSFPSKKYFEPFCKSALEVVYFFLFLFLLSCYVELMRVCVCLNLLYLLLLFDARVQKKLAIKYKHA